MARVELSGYSTQAKISLRVAELVHHGRLDLWFSREFNPIDNEPGSNPLKIFEELLQIHQAAHNPPPPDQEVDQEVSGMDYEDQPPQAYSAHLCRSTAGFSWDLTRSKCKFSVLRNKLSVLQGPALTNASTVVVRATTQRIAATRAHKPLAMHPRPAVSTIPRSRKFLMEHKSSRVRS